MVDRRRVIRFALAIAAELIFCAALHLFDDWTLEAMPLRFVVVGILSGVAYLFAVANFRQSWPAHKQVLIFWGIAVALRVVVLPLAPGDDVWRYQWEGGIQHAGFNPYVNAPNDPQLASQRERFPNSSKINHPNVRAIYPPGAELLFAAINHLSEDPLLYKLIFAAADLATIAILLRVIGGATRYESAALYAWNPLVVYSFSGGAHFDSLMIAPMMAGILFLNRHEDADAGRSKWLFAIAAATAFGVAISMKLVPLLLLPLCAVALGRRAIALLISIAIPGLCALYYGYPAVPIWEPLREFAHIARLNDLFWWLIEDTIWPNVHQKNYRYNVVLVTTAVVVSMLFIRNWKRGMLWVVGAALILSPVLHPWYCTWILPLAIWRRAWPWHILSVTLFAYFLFWNERLFSLPWHAEPWMRAIIICPPLLAGFLFLRTKRNARENS